MSPAIHQAIRQFLEKGLSNYASATQANIRRDMALWQEAIGDISPEKITVRQLNRLLRTRMAPSTARRRLASLRMAYDWWVKRGVITGNRLEDLISESPDAFPFLHTGIHRTRYMSSTDAQKILWSAQSHLRLTEVYHYLLPVLLLSGLRILEALSISYSSLRIEQGAAWIQIGEGRRIPCTQRIEIESLRQALSLLVSLRSNAKSDLLIPFGRTPAEMILRTIFRETGVQATASSLRWRGIMDHLDNGMSISVASLLFDLSEKNLQRQYGFYKR